MTIGYVEITDLQMIGKISIGGGLCHGKAALRTPKWAVAVARPIMLSGENKPDWKVVHDNLLRQNNGFVNVGDNQCRRGAASALCTAPLKWSVGCR